MVPIFSNYIDKFVEVFKDDFSIFGLLFDECLANLSTVMKRCESKSYLELGKESFYGTTRDCIGS